MSYLSGVDEAHPGTSDGMKSFDVAMLLMVICSIGKHQRSMEMHCRVRVDHVHDQSFFWVKYCVGVWLDCGSSQRHTRMFVVFQIAHAFFTYVEK